MEIEAFIIRYPRLYHMAERGTWSTIEKRGLMSTVAVLDHFGVKGDQRKMLESEHRPQKVSVGLKGDEVVLRDQIPMAPDRLVQALESGITPQQWYAFINSKVFMWAEEHRLHRLLKARNYRSLEHDVLTIDTNSLISAHLDKIWLCPMNSGNTFPIPHRRNFDTFSRVLDYPVRRSGTPVKKVVEVVADYSIPDIAMHVLEVRRMQGDVVLEKLVS